MVVIATALLPGIASIGPVLPFISREFSLSHAVASLLTTIPTLLMGLLALPTRAGAAFRKDKVLLASLVLLFVSMGARIRTNVSVLLLTTAGVGTEIAIAGTLFAGIIKARFPKKVAMMMSVYATSLAFSTTVSAAATGPIAAFAGKNAWRFATGIWSPIALIGVFAGLAILVSERREFSVASAQRASAAQLPLTNRTAWLVATFFACDNFLFFSLLSWISSIYLEQGLSATSASFVLAMFAVTFTVTIPVLAR